MISIIVLDDEPIIRRGIIKIIEENIEDVQSVTDFGKSSDCIAYLEEHSADLLITDIRMPGISGLELIQYLREKKIKTDVIVLSGYSDFEYCRKAICYHVYDYILKPIDKADFVRILRGYANTHGSAAESGEPLTEHQTVKEIKRYLRAHFQEHISLRELAEQYYLNPSYMSQLFKKETGTSVFAYLTQLRMDMAKIYLTDCTKRVSEIAELVGYESSKQFSQTFKRSFQKTPSEYRREAGITAYDDDE
jgi:two-component system response regulator YesN